MNPSIQQIYPKKMKERITNNYETTTKWVKKSHRRGLRARRGLF
jgi:hypothetical protein